MQVDAPTKRRLVVLALLIFVVLPLSLWFYHSRSNPFAPPQSKNAAVSFDNPSALQNVLPDTSFAYTLARLNEYTQAQFPGTTSVHIASPIATADGTYTFQATFLPAGSVHIISVRVVNYNSIISTAVYVDNVVVPSAAPANANGATYTGFDSLIDAGFSSYQTLALQQAFAKFASGESVSIDSTSIVAGTDPENSSYSFTVTVGSKTYKATVYTSGLTDVRLQLFDQKSGSQLFNSGVVSQAN